MRKSRRRNSSRAHVPQQDRLPYVERASCLGEDHECTITISRIEPSIEYFNHIAQPSRASDAKDVILAQMIEILAFGLVEVPSREGGVRLGDHRALDVSQLANSRHALVPVLPPARKSRAPASSFRPPCPEPSAADSRASRPEASRNRT